MNTPQHQSPSLVNLSTQTEYFLEGTTIVGRHVDCNLVLKSERGASRKHARITVENNSAVLMDLGSLNGTMVNGREISRAVQLVHGDTIIFDEQEYQFNDLNTPSQNNSDNVTVIANKDEIGRPEKIKPAIRVVESTTTTDTRVDATSEQLHSRDNSQRSFDDTEAWQVPPANAKQPPVLERSSERQDNFTAIPATSRPGGDAPKLKRRNNASFNMPDGEKRKSIWLRWFVIIPLCILVLLIAFYFAYTAGFTAAILSNINNPS